MSDNLLKISRTVSVGGETIEFPRLTLYELAPLADALKASKEREAKKLASEMSLDKRDQYNILIALRTAPLAVAELLDYADSPEGAICVLRRSLQKQNQTEEQAKAMIERLAIPECVDIAKSLILDLPQSEEPEKNSPRPGGNSGS